MPRYLSRDVHTLLALAFQSNHVTKFADPNYLNVVAERAIRGTLDGEDLKNMAEVLENAATQLKEAACKLPRQEYVIGNMVEATIEHGITVDGMEITIPENKRGEVIDLHPDDDGHTVVTVRWGTSNGPAETYGPDDGIDLIRMARPK